MTLGSPLFDTSLLTASWVTSAMAASAPSSKNNNSTNDDLYSFLPQQQTTGSTLDFVSMLGGGFAQPTFSSPDPSGHFDTSDKISTALSGSTLQTETVQTKTDPSDNALQLNVVDPLQLSPTSGTLDFDANNCGSGTQSGYGTPAFQLSPTPGLTMCPTVDSTPGPRTTSRCSSRSSFSFPETDGTHSAMTSASCTPASTPGSIRKVIGGHHGRKNSAVANGTFTPKRPHLCTYPDCERSTRTFRSNADLQRHLRSHKGERPYACPAQDCGKAYGQQNKMVKHVEQQHPMLLPRVEMNRTRTRRAAAVVEANNRNRRTSTSSQGSSIAASAYPLAYAQHMAKQISDDGQGRTRSLHASPLGASTQYNRPTPYPHPAALALAQQQLLQRQQSQQQQQQLHNQARFNASLGQEFQLPPSGQAESQWWAKALNNQLPSA